MRFTLSTLLVFIVLIAVALATICRPNATVAELVRTATILFGCASLVVGFLSTGRTQRFGLAYGTFSLASLGLHACPKAIAKWVSQIAPPPEPVFFDPSGAGFGGSSLAIPLTEYWFVVFIGIAAGAIAAGGFRPSKKG